MFLQLVFYLLFQYHFDHIQKEEGTRMGAFCI
jgi:hypothetical protein